MSMSSSSIYFQTRTHIHVCSALFEDSLFDDHMSTTKKQTKQTNERTNDCSFLFFLISLENEKAHRIVLGIYVFFF